MAKKNSFSPEQMEAFDNAIRAIAAGKKEEAKELWNQARQMDPPRKGR